MHSLLKMSTQTKPSILFLHSSSDYYGASKVLLQTIIACKSSGYKCIVVLSEPGIFSEKLIENGIDVHFFKLAILRRKYYNLLGILNRAYYLVKAIGQLRSLIKTYHIDIVYSNTTAVLVGALASKICKVKHVWHIHEIIAGPRILLWVLSWLMEFATHKNISVSSATFHHWNSINPSLTKKHKLICLFNGIDLLPYQSIQEKNHAFNKFIIGMIGRVNSWKGQSYFIEIVSELEKLIQKEKNNQKCFWGKHENCCAENFKIKQFGKNLFFFFFFLLCAENFVIFQHKNIKKSVKENIFCMCIFFFVCLKYFFV